MINKYFGYWHVLSHAPRNIGDLQHQYVLARCVCMRKKYVRTDDLKSGKSKSCGCSRSRKLLELIGTTHNRWTILELGPVINTHRYARCMCSCGYVADVRIAEVVKGNTKSCGCYGVERLAEYYKQRRENSFYIS